MNTAEDQVPRDSCAYIYMQIFHEINKFYSLYVSIIYPYMQSEAWSLGSKHFLSLLSTYWGAR